LLQAGYFIMSCPEQILIENILLKLTTKAKLLTSRPNKCTAMQTAEVSMSCPAC